MIMKKILFITTSDLATNPRLVKEIELASENNFEISVVYFKIKGWSNSLTNQYVQNNRHIKFLEISATRNPFLPWLFSSLTEVTLRKINPQYLTLKFLAYSLNKRSILLNYKLKSIKKSFDWVIAHNPGTFYPALKFSKKNGAKLGIDVEDYHPGESLNVEINNRMELLMNKVLPHAEYCSFAAPLIEKEVQTQTTNEIKKSFVVLNGFNELDFEFKRLNKGKLKMVWYSQNIDFGRGLETFLVAFCESNLDIELTLMGNLKPKFATLLDSFNNPRIKQIDPIPQTELHKLLCDYDVGLALDFAVDRNREIALTNKIISYVQAGLYIFGFKTEAQVSFILEKDLDSLLVKNEIDEIKLGLEKLVEKFVLNQFDKSKQFEKGKLISWQNISKPLIQQWIG